MIAQIKGTVLESTPLLVVLEVAGVGYEVHIPITTAEKVSARSEPSAAFLSIASIVKTARRFTVLRLVKTATFIAY